MDGGEIIAFTLRTVPKSIQAVYEAQDWAPHDLDALIMHQANGLIVSSLAKRVGVTPAQVPRTLEEYGNTSSASIPLTLTHYLTLAKPSQDRKVVFSGFGVGLSWASVSLALSNPVSTGILYYG